MCQYPTNGRRRRLGLVNSRRKCITQFQQFLRSRFPDRRRRRRKLDEKFGKTVARRGGRAIENRGTLRRRRRRLSRVCTRSDRLIHQRVYELLATIMLRVSIGISIRVDIHPRTMVRSFNTTLSGTGVGGRLRLPLCAHPLGDALPVNTLSCLLVSPDLVLPLPLDHPALVTCSPSLSRNQEIITPFFRTRIHLRTTFGLK